MLLGRLRGGIVVGGRLAMRVSESLRGIAGQTDLVITVGGPPSTRKAGIALCGLPVGLGGSAVSNRVRMVGLPPTLNAHRKFPSVRGNISCQ